MIWFPYKRRFIPLHSFCPERIDISSTFVFSLEKSHWKAFILLSVPQILCNFIFYTIIYKDIIPYKDWNLVILQVVFTRNIIICCVKGRKRLFLMITNQCKIKINYTSAFESFLTVIFTCGLCQFSWLFNNKSSKNKFALFLTL